MNTKNVIGIAALVIAVVFAMQIIRQDRVEAQQSSEVTQNVEAVEYAMLDVEGEDRVTWRIGGIVNERTESVRTAYRRLGGEGRGTFPDLLNQIGSGGWNLIQKDGGRWIFSRRAS